MAKKKMTLEEKLEEAIVKDVPYNVPENWVWTNLAEILLTLETGKRPKGGVSGIENGIPSLGGEHLNYNGGFNFDKVKFVPTEFAESLKKGVIEENDILIVKDGATTGKCSYVDSNFPFTKAVINEHVFKCRTVGNINSKFVFWYIVSTIGQYYIKLNLKGSAQGGINTKFIDNFVVCLPPLEEQERIVDKIESLFEKLDKSKELIEEARDDFEKRKSAILEKAFRGELTKEWRKNNTVDIYGVNYLDEISKTRMEIYNNLLDYSKKNKTKKPTKIHDVNYECIKHKECSTWIKTKLGNVLYDFRYGTSSKSDYSFTGKPVIRIPNLNNGYIDHNDMKYLKEDIIDINHKVKVGDLLIVRSNGSPLLVGKTSLITDNEDGFAFASYLIRIRPCKVDSKYLYYVLNSVGVKEQFYSKSKSTSGINNINTDELGNSIISLPPLEEQKEIVRILDKLLEEESKIEELTQLEEQIELIKKSILAKAFRGQLGTNCEEDESALELLKKILSDK